MEKYLKITVETDPYDEYNAISAVRHEEVDASSILKDLSDWQLNEMGLMRFSKDKNGKLDENTVAWLKHHGWVNAAAAKTRAEKKELEQKFYLLREPKTNKYGYSYSYNFYEIDLDKVADSVIDDLVEGGHIVQRVSTKSVLGAADYKKIETRKKQKAAAAEARKLAAEKKKETKRLKEIEQAKKLLAEAGELS